MIELVITEQQVSLVGELTRYTIVQLPKSTVQTLLNKTIITLDLSGVAKTDTAGLAWLIALKEQAIKQGKTLVFSHQPEKLIKLMQLSGVESFLR